MTNSSCQRDMHPTSIPLCALLLIVSLQMSNTYPIGNGLTDTDMDIFKVLLHKLEESVSEQAAVDQGAPEERDGPYNLGTDEAADEQQAQIGPDEAEIRELLSAKNLKSLRNDASRRSSGCFGRRMDRIGSMSSLGCNTIGKYNPK